MHAPTATKWVYDFADGSREMRDLLGGKGANLAEMTRVLGPELVPAGFTITTEACVAYMGAGGRPPDGLAGAVGEAVAELEERAGRRLGDRDDPLLLSVRSGARDSMPGMMDTVLNLGLDDATVEGVAARTGNPRFAWDCYRRLVQMFGDVVHDGQRGADGPGFFVVPDWWMCNYVHDEFEAHLRSHGGQRPVNPGSTHCAIHPGDVELWRDRWDQLGIL